VSCRVGETLDAFVTSFFIAQTALLRLGRIDTRHDLTEEETSLMALLFVYGAEINQDPVTVVVIFR